MALGKHDDFPNSTFENVSSVKLWRCAVCLIIIELVRQNCTLVLESSSLVGCFTRWSLYFGVMLPIFGGHSSIGNCHLHSS
jgi:hypothetical protein